jgi:hypothetical protein
VIKDDPNAAGRRGRSIPPRTALLCLALALTSLGPGASVAAAAGPSFALKPLPVTKLGYFVFSAQPGGTVHGQVQVVNVGSETGSVSLYAVDATTGQTSGAVYRSRQEPRRDVGRWIQLSVRSLTLNPGQEETVPFSATVPRRATPGQHLGGIVAQPAAVTSTESTAPGKHSFKVRIQELSVLAVQVDLPGPQRAKMDLSGIKAGGQPGHQALLLGITNDGSVLVQGHGSLDVVDQGGHSVQRRRFNLDTFVPHTHIELPVYVEGKAMRPGRYNGTVSIVYRGDRLTRTFPFRVSAANLREVFGSAPSQPPPSRSSSEGPLVGALIVLSAISIATAGFFFLRSRRAA